MKILAKEVFNDKLVSLFRCLHSIVGSHSGSEIPIFSNPHSKTWGLDVSVQYRYEHEHAHSVRTGYCTFIQEQFVPTSGPRQCQRNSVMRVERLG